ncbi:MAG: class II fumarate hydratase [Gammaproteobacteria bacterium]|nr:class II fumarate hydratase [Gammaproteobacteria bacterium]MCW8922234.1 class II fumarate hydratase [Gammaproteobacteria bacterium]
MTKTRTVKDSMGELEVSETACYGAQTQRAIDNFPVSGLAMPAAFLQALGRVKLACAEANQRIGGLEEAHCQAIIDICHSMIAGELDSQFPVDVFQTGSGTSTNMNANEVIAHLASQKSDIDVHPNDHVNMSQSSNDVIPTAIHVSASIACEERLLPALVHLENLINNRADELQDVVTTGRTHLMDAMPITLGQELGGWAAQVRSGIERVQHAMPAMKKLAIGGTAVGTGINAPEEFGSLVADFLEQQTGLRFSVADDRFENMSSQDAAVALSGQLKALAVSLLKISNDLRWMNSGPLAGIGEIALPALQPGSSIMPGKVNPVIPESVAMVCAKVIGNDAAITIAGQSGNFQLNVMLPLVAYDLLQSIDLLASASRLLADKAIAGFTVNHENIENALAKNPILVTALNRVIGYELGAKIAKQAYAEGRAVIDVASELTDISRDELERLLAPENLTRGGVQE